MKLDELRGEILSHIKTVLRNCQLEEVSLSDTCQGVSFPFISTKGIPYEAHAVIVRITNKKLSVVCDCEAFEEVVDFVEDHSCLQNPYLLLEIFEALISALSDFYERVCHECGKPMDVGYCIDGGMEYYCSESCLHKHYTPEEWAEIYDNGNGDNYFTEWEDADE